MKICYIDDNDDYLNRFKDDFADILSNHICSVMRTPSEYLSSDEVCDVLLLDIEFGDDGNGLDYIDDVINKNQRTQIIMVTAYTEKYIQEVFLKKDNVAGFLVKPIAKDALMKSLEKAEELIERSRSTILKRECKGGYVKIKVEDVLYMESVSHNIKYVTVTGTYLCVGKLDDECRHLPYGFMRCHKSFCVNMRKINGFVGDNIIIDGCPTIPVSRAKRQEFLLRYTGFLADDKT